MKSRLNLNLPKTKDSELYQLVHVGAFSKSIDNPQNFGVDIYFHLKGGIGLKKFIGEPIKKNVNVHHFPRLKVGSLWNHSGRLIENSQTVIKTQRTFTLKGDGNVVTLNTVLRNYSGLFGLLEGVAWEDAKKTYYYKISIEDESILIPSTEIARFFYYRGANLIDFFFSRSKLDLICTSEIPPLEVNQYNAKINLLTNSFKRAEIPVLAEMLFNLDFRKGVMDSHGKLTYFFSLNRPENPRLIQGFSGNDPTISVNGISISYGAKNIFVVCSIFGASNSFSFKSLECEANSDFYINNASNNLSGISYEENNKWALHFDKPENLIVDSNQEGSGRYANAEINEYIDDYIDMPPIVFVNTSERKSHTNTIFSAHSPSVLSERGGGSNPDIAKGSVTYIAVEIEIKEYFRNMINGFREHKSLNRDTNFKVIILQISNSEQSCESGVSLFKYSLNRNNHSLYQIGIVELYFKKGYFYFIQAFHGGRAALLYKSNANQLSKIEIFDILEVLADNEWDWVELNSLDGKEHVQILIGARVFIYPRNKIEVKNSVNLCVNDIANFS